MALPSVLETCAVLIIVLGLAALTRPRQPDASRGVPLPPGPHGLPVVGNTFQVPREHVASYFRQLCKDFSGLVSLKAGGKTLILLGDGDLAHELLERRASRFSSRPAPNLYFSRYVNPDGIRWVFEKVGRNYYNGRRLTAKAMTSVRAGKQEPLAGYEALLTLRHLLDSPEAWFEHIQRFSGSVTLSAMFGTHFDTHDAPQLVELFQHLKDMSVATALTSSIINILPWLDYLPGPMPWRTRAKALAERDRRIYQRFADQAEEKSRYGVETWASMFRGKDKYGNDLVRLINLFTGAAIHTTSASLQNFILACVSHPNSIKPVQAQLDAIVGNDRLPSFADGKDLLEVEAVVRETLRWRPALRTAIPHQSTSDEVIDYNGKQYFIPSGSVVFGLPWAIEHDESKYPDADTFLPSRQLDEQGNLKEGYSTTTFGWGLRVCPGTPFAMRSLWITIATILWAFDVRPLPGYTYRTDDSAFTATINASPLKFPVVFQPRSHIRAEVIKKVWSECEGSLTDLMGKE